MKSNMTLEEVTNRMAELIPTLAEYWELMELKYQLTYKPPAPGSIQDLMNKDPLGVGM
jgi:hypothetical protein